MQYRTIHIHYQITLILEDETVKTTVQKLRKIVFSGGIALLIGFTFLTPLTSCSKGNVSMDASVSSKEEWDYTANAGSGYDDYFGDYAAEMPKEENIDSTASANSAGNEVQNDLAARKMIRTANLTVETKNFDEFMTTLEGNISSMGGYLSSSSINGTSYKSEKIRSANLTVRIPADTYDSFVSGIGGYSNVTYRTESVNDVTMAYVDTESRIKAYETEYATLLEILEKATNLDDVLVIQNRITEVTYQLESYRSQLRKYDDLISYCTVHINVSEVVELTTIKEPPKTVAERMAQGISDTWDDITDDAENFAVGFVSALPALVIWAVIIALAAIIAKAAISKRKKKHAAKKNGSESKNHNNETKES